MKMATPQVILGDSRPVPDPTALTTEQIEHASECLREVIETRLDGMDKAIELLQKTTDRFPVCVKDAVDHLKDLHDEKFTSVQTQLRERDERVKQTALDTQKAVDAALQAAEKAVGKQQEAFALSIDKSERATMKQIDGLQLLLANNQLSMEGKNSDLKERLTRIEGMGIGQISATVEQRAVKTETQASGNYVMAIIGAIVGVGGIIIAVVMR